MNDTVKNWADLQKFPLVLGGLFKIEDRIICIRNIRTVEAPTPREVFVGEGAFQQVQKLCVDNLIAFYRCRLAELEDAFLKATSFRMLPFMELPLECYPPDHPFRSNGGFELLLEYQRVKALGSLRSDGPSPPVVSSKKELVVFGCSTEGESSPWSDLTLYYTKKMTPPGYLSSLSRYSPIKPVAIDKEGNVWISLALLRQFVLEQ